MAIPKTLVLNKDYQPFNLFPLQKIDASEAIKRVMNGTCSVVTEYERQIKTPNHIMFWPAIIIKTEYVQMERIAILRKEALYYRDGKKCAYCSKNLREDEATMDHVIPRGLGGKHNWENLVIACPECNHTKAMVHPGKSNGKWEPRIKPYKPTYWELLNIRKNYPIKVDHVSWIDFIGPWNAEIILEK